MTLIWPIFAKKNIGFRPEQTEFAGFVYTFHSFRMVLTILGVIVIVVLGLIGWCIYRFCKKKRPKGAEDKTMQDDENALVDNEEANVEEVSMGEPETPAGTTSLYFSHDVLWYMAKFLSKY